VSEPTPAEMLDRLTAEAHGVDHYRQDARFLSEPGSHWIEIETTYGDSGHRSSFHADMVTSVVVTGELWGSSFGQSRVDWSVGVWCVGAPNPVWVLQNVDRRQADETADLIRAEVTLRRTR